MTAIQDPATRVLFVDDEANVLDGLRVVLRKQRREWEMVFALGADQALSEMRTKPFDVVVTDMRMPGMDGAALLAAVREEYPATIRIILSGHSEREAAMRALPVCHQFLAKPCEADVLKAAITSALDARGLVGDETLRRLLGGIDQLPALPRIYSELTAEVESPTCSTKRLAAIVESDPGIAANILKVVNSSFFGLAHRVTSVERAIAYLGIELVRNLALTAKAFELSPSRPIQGFSVDELQAQSFLTAAVARRIAVAGTADDAYAAGLLHDVGQLILAHRHRDRYASALDCSRVKGVDVEDAERGEFGVSHAEVGAYLVGLWGLPVAIVDAIARHHRPRSELVGLAATIAMADDLVGWQLSGGTPATAPEAAQPEWLVVATDEVTRWRTRG